MNSQPRSDFPEYNFDMIRLNEEFSQIISGSPKHIFSRFLEKRINSGNMDLKSLKEILERIAKTTNGDEDPTMQGVSKKCVTAIVEYFNSNFNELFQISSNNTEGMRCLSIIGKLIDSLKEGFRENTYRENELALLIRTLDIYIGLLSDSIEIGQTVPGNVDAILGRSSRSADVINLSKLLPPDTTKAPLAVPTERGELTPSITFGNFEKTVIQTAFMGIPTTHDGLSTSPDIARVKTDAEAARTQATKEAQAHADTSTTAVLDDILGSQTDDQGIRSRNIGIQGISQLRSNLSKSIEDEHLGRYIDIGKDGQGGHGRFGLAGRTTEIRKDSLSNGIQGISTFTEAIAFGKEVLKNTKPIANPNNLVEGKLIDFLNDRTTQIRNKLLLDLSAYIQDTLTESLEVIPLLSSKIDSTIINELTRGLSRGMRMLRHLEAPKISASAISTLLDEVNEIIRGTQIVINHSLALGNDTQPATTVGAVGSTVGEVKSALNIEPKNNVAYRGLPPTEGDKEVTHPIAKTGQETFNDWASDSLLQGMGTSGHALVSKPNTSEITPEAPPAPAPAPVEKPIYLRDCLESYSYQDTEIILQTSIGSLRVLDFKETDKKNCMKIRFQNINSKSISTYAVNLNNARVGMPEITGIEGKFAINYVLLGEYDTDGEIREIQKTGPNGVRRPVAGLHVTIDSIEIQQIPEKENLGYHLGYLTPENPVVLNAGKEDELRMIDLPPYDKKFKDGTFRFEKNYRRVTIQRKSKSTGGMTTDIYVIDIHAARIGNTKSMFKGVYVDGVLKLFQNQYIIDSIHSGMIREKVAKTRGSIWGRVTSLFSSGENSKEPEVIKQTQVIIPTDKPDQNIPTTMPIALEPPILLRPQPSPQKSPPIQPQSTPPPPTSLLNRTIQSTGRAITKAGSWVRKLFGS